MPIRRIVFSNVPVLHETSRRVRRVDEDVQELVEDMIETMRDADGIGLAAVQIGVPERIIVVEIPVVSEEAEEKPDEPLETELYVLINPELVHASEELEEGIEGCLSVPGWVGEVERHQSVTVAALDRSGRKIRLQAEGLLARVLQHEIDHCQGVLFIDHIDDPEKIWRVEVGQEEAAEAAQEVPSG
ncbi:MAG: peptide deformylase [Anaerolineae bacterium]|nr:peptide deformylase [Anaerolineae bacterium]